ncbi:DUF5819 family protein [Pyxidicoccus xibeiensis]|uniref:DUF5819 family protein n=1 Tax=Pyxidicoccus xibeiensis TaxID=2906759 RepID=UPI0020A78B85|nr:DUF5819 family protein [Pyxidicoccus xibeiensis]MCP3142454.1 DUF5819 family protein [Pyxidicoccus xibeiensis]
MADKGGDALGRRLVRIAPAVLLLVIVMHFGITLAYLTPINPAKLRVSSLLDGYMEPFFAQRWTLFGPDVAARTKYLLVSCRAEDARGEVREHPFVNITRPLRELKQRHRLTPADRLDRAQLAGVKMSQAQDDEVARRLLEKPEDSEPYRQAVALVEQQRKQRRERGFRLVIRVASAACASLHPGEQIRDVRVRIATIQAPPFSRRMEPEESGETSYADSDWHPFEATETL